MLCHARSGRGPPTRLIHQPVEHAHVRGGLLQRVLKPRPLCDQCLVRDLNGRLASEQEASAGLRRELSGQRAAQRIEIGEIGDAPRRAASFAETHHRANRGARSSRSPASRRCVRTLLPHAPAHRRPRRPANGDEQASAVGLVLLPHGV